MAINIIHLFQTMEQEIIKGGGKEENTQPYKTYEGWLSEIEEYIQRIVTNKKPVKHNNMNNFNRKDYQIIQERNYPKNKTISNSYLEKKTREERFANIISKQTSSNKFRHRGKSEWLI